MTFMVKLIKVNNTANIEARDNLYANCTHVAGDYWLFEGDEIGLSFGIDFDIVGEEVIESYGSLSGKAIKEMVKEIYGVNI